MPRNAHHWMVISDSLFDHRQHLMLNALKLHNIADELIAKWTKIEEQFRSDIVKYQSWPKRVGNILIDTEQYETTMIDEATICDYCSAEIPKYTTVRYHRRIGKVGCSTCSPNMQDNT
jgi:deoxyhypusine synthase